jgi:hypothetical protein
MNKILVLDLFRVCNKCGIEKPIEEFREYTTKGKKYRRHNCKECDKEYNHKYFSKESKEERKLKVDIKEKDLFRICKKCGVEKQIDEFEKRQEDKDWRRWSCKDCEKKRVKIYQSEYNNKPESKLNKKLYNKKYVEENKDRIKENNSEYYKNNKEEIITKRGKYQKNRRQTDPEYRITDLLRRRVNSAIKSKSMSKKVILSELEPFRVCKHCGVEKPIEEFSTYKTTGNNLSRRYKCKACEKEYHRKRDEPRCAEQRQATIDRRANKPIELFRICNICKIEKPIDKFLIRSEKSPNDTIYRRGECKDCGRDYDRKYVKENLERLREYIRNWTNENNKKPDIKIKNLLRGRILGAIKSNKKSDSTLKLVGCNLEFLLGHLQKTAEDNGYLDFDIRNYSGEQFHIDHLIPCSAFNLNCTYHQRLCFNWSNLQILDAVDNIIKHDKLIKEYIDKSIQTF